MQIVFFILAMVLILKTFANPLISLYQRKKISSHVSAAQHQIELFRPLVFIKLFANSLTVVFFPQYLLKLTLHSGMPASFASVIYVIYQLFFVLMLIPGGYFGEVKSIKKILLVTTFIEAFIFMGFVFSTNIWEILVLQALFGCVIPISSSADYAYILNFTSHKDRSFGFALYSNSLKGSVIAGIVIGGMMVGYLGPSHVFLVASGLVFTAFIYLLFFIPNVTLDSGRLIQARKASMSFKFVLKEIPGALRNFDFVKTVFCTGFPLGFLDDGIVLFSLPLLLSYAHFSQAVIGQLLVIVSLGFFLSNKFISKKADKLNSKKKIIMIGLLGISMGLLFISGLKIQPIGLPLFIIALALLGIFRGFLASPSVSYIAENSTAERLGENVVLSIYRLFQALGSILGPILIMQLLIQYHYSALSYIILAAIFFIFFLLMLTRKDQHNTFIIN